MPDRVENAEIVFSPSEKKTKKNKPQFDSLMVFGQGRQLLLRGQMSNGSESYFFFFTTLLLTLHNYVCFFLKYIISCICINLTLICPDLDLYKSLDLADTFVFLSGKKKQTDLNLLTMALFDAILKTVKSEAPTVAHL